MPICAMYVSVDYADMCCVCQCGLGRYVLYKLLWTRPICAVYVIVDYADMCCVCY